MTGAAIEFIKGAGTRYRSLLHRPDGVVIEFDGGAYNKIPARVPHDIAHLIVEDELRLTQAEILTGAVCHVVRADLHPRGDDMKRAVGERWWTDDLTPEALERCRLRLRTAAKSWAALPAGGTFSGRWDHAVDPGLAVGSRGAHTRGSRSRRATRSGPATAR